MAGWALVEELDQLGLEDNDDELLEQVEQILAGTAFGEYCSLQAGRVL